MKTIATFLTTIPFFFASCTTYVEPDDSPVSSTRSTTTTTTDHATGESVTTERTRSVYPD